MRSGRWIVATVGALVGCGSSERVAELPVVMATTRPFGSIAEQWSPLSEGTWPNAGLGEQWSPRSEGTWPNAGLGEQWSPLSQGSWPNGGLGEQFAPPTLSPSSTSLPPTSSVIEATTPMASAGQQDPAVLSAVAAQVGATEAAYYEALRHPEDPSLLAGIEGATADGSRARAEFVGAYKAIIDSGQWAEPDPDVANTVTLEAAPLLSADGTAALVLVCVVSGDSLMRLDADGSPQVVSDVRNAHRIAETFVLDGNRWRLSERHLVATFPEATTCDSGLDQQASSVP